MPFRPAKSRSGQLSVGKYLPALRLAAFASASVLAVSSLRATDTEIDVNATATDLTTAGSYTPGTTPSAATDVTFTSGATYTSPTGFTINSNVAFGTLNDLNATALAISNTGGAADTLTLGGGTGDVVGGSNSADLLYVATGASLTINGGTGNTALGIALASSGNFDIAGTANISSAISGAFAITKTGGGSLTLSGANTYSGNTTLQGGTIKLGSSSVGTAGTVGSNGALTSGALGTGSFVISTTSTFDLNGQTLGNRFTNSGNGSFITNTNVTTAIISGAMDGSITGSNVISDFVVGSSAGDITWTGKLSRVGTGNFNITKNGTDTVNFFGTTSDSGVGTITVNAGTVGLGTAGTGAAVADSATVAGGTLKFRPDVGAVSGGNPWAGELNGSLTLNSGTVDLFGSSGQNSRQQQFLGTGGTLTNTSATAGVLGVAARNGNSYTFAGTVQDGTGTVGIDFSNQGATGSGRINQFTGTNTYSGTTSISYGTFELGNALAAQNSTLIVNAASGLGANSTISYTTISPLAFANAIGTFTIGGLSGAGNFSLTDIGFTNANAAATAGSVTLQIGSSLAANAAPAAYTGVISDGTVAGGKIVKIGTSTEIFSAADTYTGTTTISAGILQLGAGSTTGSLSASSAITDNGTLAINRSNTATQGADFSGAAITGSGTLTMAGGGTLVLSAANTYAGGTTATAGTIQLGSSTNTGTLTSGPLGIGTVQISSGGSATLDLNGQTISNAFVSGGNGATFTNSSANVATVSNGFNATGANGVVISDFTVNGTGNINWSGAIARTNGGGEVTKGGTNTLTLSGAGTSYTNLAYVVSGGTFALNLTNGSTFNQYNGFGSTNGIQNSANVAGAQTSGVTNTIAAVISGTGTFTQSGAGTSILTATNTYSGATSVSVGSLLVNGSITGTGNVTVTSGATLGGAGNGTSTGLLAGTATINGTVAPGTAAATIGMLTLSSTGGATIAASGIYLADLNATTSDNLKLSGGALTITSGATLTFNTLATPTAASYDLANYTSYTGAFTVTNLPSGYTLRYGGTELDLVTAAVPEPSTWAVGVLCIGAFGLRMRRRLGGLFSGRRAA